MISTRRKRPAASPKRSDNHSHIILAATSDMLASAQAKHVNELSVTEHVSQFTELRRQIRFGSVHKTGRMFSSLDEYVNEFQKIQNGAGGRIRVNRGLEVDFSPRFTREVADFVKRKSWDILLCSVHEVGDGNDIEKTLPEGRIADVSSRWENYFQLQTAALESRFIPFNVLAHPIRMARSTKIIPRDIDELLLTLARTASKNGRALELNGNDITYSVGLVRRLAQACAKAGCKVSLGSDAHHPQDIFRNLEVASRLVEEYELILA